MTLQEARVVAKRYVGAMHQTGVGPKGRIWGFKVAATKPPHDAMLISKGGYHATLKERTATRNKLARHFAGLA